jgi:hypothetical protein
MMSCRKFATLDWDYPDIDCVVSDVEQFSVSVFFAGLRLQLLCLLSVAL